MNISEVVKEFGLPVGLLLASLYYIFFMSIPKVVWERDCAEKAQLVDSVGKLADRLNILLDRGSAK